uniref:TLC domain-containing protein n=1 Tax=Spumella elongata TaxID=89044 RepID=A0A7S3LZR4_9STRA|mmetsp:Transcript_1630/g.2656  ORF Transcript_1630/g.2656 Transcript_1630/m.2656 type:complete len:239 (+) Transcript_1630:44-760(+)
MPLTLQSALSISLPYAGFCFALHALFTGIFSNRITSFSKSNKASFYNRCVSTVHALIMFSLALYYWLFINPTVVIVPMTDYESGCLLLMEGYLLYDTIFELSTGGRNIMTIGHHVMGFLSHSSSLISYNGAAGFYSMIIFLAEGSTPLLNASWLLQKLNMLDTSLFQLCAIGLLGSFFVLRVLLSPYMVIHMFLYQTSWGENTFQLFWFNFVIVFSFMLLNYFWFYKLVSLAFKKTKK